MKGWMIELKVNTNNIVESLEIIGSLVFFLLIGVLISFAVSRCTGSLSALSNDQWWGGYYPGELYQIYDKDTGVYYCITDDGHGFPLYTINGELKLVDQGNEYVVHKNLGEPDDASQQ